MKYELCVTFFIITLLVSGMVVSATYIPGMSEARVGFRIGTRNSTQTNQSSSNSGKYRFQLNMTDSLGIDALAHFRIYNNQTKQLINESFIDGISYIESGNAKIDLELNFSDYGMDIKFKNLDMLRLNSTVNDLIVDIISPVVDEDVIVYKAFHINLPNRFSYASIDFKLTYDDFDPLDENNLKIYKCSNYDLEADECNGDWIVYNPSKDSVNKIASIEITGFSAYALGENEGGATTTSTTATSTTTSTTATSTTTTTTTTTVPQSSSSGNSGGSSSSSNNINLNPTTTTTRPPTTSTTSGTTSSTTTTTTAEPSTGTVGFSVLTDNYPLLSIPIAAVVGFVLFHFFRQRNGKVLRTVYGRYGAKTRSAPRKKYGRTKDKTTLKLQL